MKKFFTINILLLMAMMACSKLPVEMPSNETNSDTSATVEKTNQDPAIKDEEGISFQDIPGRWKLIYRNNFGYDFRFYKNYKTIIIIYLKNQSIIFKGVYTIENKNTLRINIYEMKRSMTVRTRNLSSGFVKTQSSFFVFHAGIVKKNTKRRMLILKPKQIVIDNNNSDGYFEPVLKLRH